MQKPVTLADITDDGDSLTLPRTRRSWWAVLPVVLGIVAASRCIWALAHTDYAAAWWPGFMTLLWAVFAMQALRRPRVDRNGLYVVDGRRRIPWEKIARIEAPSRYDTSLIALDTAGTQRWDTGFPAECLPRVREIAPASVVVEQVSVRAETD